jgi:hypothetical protein
MSGIHIQHAVIAATRSASPRQIGTQRGEVTISIELIPNPPITHATLQAKTQTLQIRGIAKGGQKHIPQQDNSINTHIIETASATI